MRTFLICIYYGFIRGALHVLYFQERYNSAKGKLYITLVLTSNSIVSTTPYM